MDPAHAITEQIDRLHITIPDAKNRSGRIGSLTPASSSQTLLDSTLLTALQTQDLTLLLSLSSKLKDFSTLQCAIYLAARVKMPYMADHKETLLLTIFELAKRFANMTSDDTEKWGMFADFIDSPFELDDLAKCLNQPNNEKQDVDRSSLLLLWGQLSNAINRTCPLVDLQLLSCYNVIDDWLTAQKEFVKTHEVLLCTFSMASGTNPKLWELSSLASQFHEPFFRAVFIIDDAQFKHKLLEDYTKLLASNAESTFSPISLSNILLILQYIIEDSNEPPIFNPIICVTVLNSKAKAPLKNEIVSLVIASNKSFSVLFLHHFFSKLQSLLMEEVELYKNILEHILNSPWTSEYIKATDEPDTIYDVKDIYQKGITFIACVKQFFTHFFLEPDCWGPILQSQYLFAESLVKNFETFCTHIGKLSPNAQKRIAQQISPICNQVSGLFDAVLKGLSDEDQLELYRRFEKAYNKTIQPWSDAN